ncbi:hypothetical protein CsSME_00031863 [Camellia sinensis var. sinensis]
MGSKKLFNIIGTGFFGNVFEILMVLPEIMDLLISGLIEEKEDAESRVTVAVGMNVGSTVFASHCSGEFSELEALVLDIMLEKLNIEKEYAIAEMLKSFDVNKYGTITQDEFIERCKKWIHKGKQLAEDGGLMLTRLGNIFSEQPRIEKKQHELVKIEHIMSEILKHFQNQVLEAEGLVTDDGKPKIWHKKVIFHLNLQITCKEVDSLMYEVEENLGMIHMLLSWGCIKSILQIILGVAIANFLAEPLIYNILDSSVALGLPTFNIPFALKFKSAVSLIFPASQKSIKTASLTFSETLEHRLLRSSEHADKGFRSSVVLPARAFCKTVKSAG